MARRELLSEGCQTKTKKPKNPRLTMNQSFEVTTYLECQRERIIGKMTVPEVMAELKGKFPDWPITENAVKATLRVRNIKPKYPPRVSDNGDGKTKYAGGAVYYKLKEANEKIANLTSRVEVLEAELGKVQKELGIKILEAFLPRDESATLVTGS